MNIENVTAELRPRSAWEAADLGARMIRRDAVDIYKVWFAITLPMIALATTAIYLGASSFWALLLYWWLEPITDGPILHIISTRLFGENTDYRAALKAAPGLAWRNKIFMLTPYRFHFARSIAVPVVQLEGVSGKRRRARATVLNHGIYNYGVGLTAAYQHLYLSLYVGLVLVGYALVPLEYQGTAGASWLAQFWESDTATSAMLALALSYVAQSVLHPWFVGCGFGLYINRRTQLEAWDVEVAFRRMVARRQLLATAALVLIVPVLLGQNTARADSPPQIQGYWTEQEVSPALKSTYARGTADATRDHALGCHQPRGREKVTQCLLGSSRHVVWRHRGGRAVADCDPDCRCACRSATQVAAVFAACRRTQANVVKNCTVGRRGPRRGSAGQRTGRGHTIVAVRCRARSAGFVVSCRGI